MPERMSTERLGFFESRFPQQVFFPEYVELIAEVKRAQANEDAQAATIEDLEEQIELLEE